MTPGLTDSHVHFTDGGMYLSNVALRDAAWVNSAALRRAGITRETPNPPGGG